MNNRANIMFFIDVLCEMAGKEDANSGGVGSAGYGGVGDVGMMQRDIMRVVDAVCPVDGTGAANVRVVRKVCYFLPFFLLLCSYVFNLFTAFLLLFSLLSVSSREERLN